MGLIVCDWTIDGYSGQRFETLREEPSSHGTVLVHTRLVDPAGEADLRIVSRTISVRRLSASTSPASVTRTCSEFASSSTR